MLKRSEPPKGNSISGHLSTEGSNVVSRGRDCPGNDKEGDERVRKEVWRGRRKESLVSRDIKFPRTGRVQPANIFLKGCYRSGKREHDDWGGRKTMDEEKIAELKRVKEVRTRERLRPSDVSIDREKYSTA